MSSVQIDVDKFLQVISSALQQCVIKPIEEPPKAKKRGRPRKVNPNSLEEQKKIPTNDEIDQLNIESIEEILAFKPPKEALEPGRALRNTVAAKRVGWKPPSGSQAIAAQSVVDKNRKQRFVDDKSVPLDNDEWKKRYASNEPTQRRPPAKKMTFTCDRCRQSFEAYPSEYMHAFIKEKDPVTGEESKPMVKCSECEGRPL